MYLAMSDMNPVEQQVDLILRVVPNAKTLVPPKAAANSQIQVEKMKAYAAKGIKS